MNTLYPIFIKPENIQILLVGGGKVAAEKVQFILKNSPTAQITIVATEIKNELLLFMDKFLDKNQQKQPFHLQQKQFEAIDIENKHLVIAATNNKIVNQQIYEAGKARKVLVNVADTPELCDFYLGSIVTKGDLKIAISTNGKSPTLSKRLREFFEAILPENTNDLISNLNQYRDSLKGNLEEKMKKLNELTMSLLK